MDHIRKTLQENDYPIAFINKRIERILNSNPENIIPNINQHAIHPQQNSTNSISNQNNEHEEEKEKDEFWVPLPYIGNTSNKVGGYLRRKMKWKVTPGIKILNMLPSLKDKEKPNQAGVYSIPCASCNYTYIGETIRFEERKEDHEGNVRRREYKKISNCKAHHKK